MLRRSSSSIVAGPIVCMASSRPAAVIAAPEAVVVFDGDAEAAQAAVRRLAQVRALRAGRVVAAETVIAQHDAVLGEDVGDVNHMIPSSGIGRHGPPWLDGLSFGRRSPPIHSRGSALVEACSMAARARATSPYLATSSREISPPAFLPNTALPRRNSSASSSAGVGGCVGAVAAFSNSATPFVASAREASRSFASDAFFALAKKVSSFFLLPSLPTGTDRAGSSEARERSSFSRDASRAGGE